jgi:hypothetical protein
MSESYFMNSGMINLNKKIMDFWLGYANKAADLSYGNSLFKLPSQWLSKTKEAYEGYYKFLARLQHYDRNKEKDETLIEKLESLEYRVMHLESKFEALSGAMLDNSKKGIATYPDFEVEDLSGNKSIHKKRNSKIKKV